MLRSCLRNNGLVVLGCFAVCCGTGRGENIYISRGNPDRSTGSREIGIKGGTSGGPKGEAVSEL